MMQEISRDALRAEPGRKDRDYSQDDNGYPSGQQARKDPKKLRPNTKNWSVVDKLRERGPLGMNCFEAVRWCHDYTLRSTISSLRKEYGFIFLKKEETVPGYRGSSVHCVRYSFAPSDYELTRELMGEEAEAA